MYCQLLVVLLTLSSARATAISFEQDCVAAHNFYRALHPGTPPLKWNARLAAEAQLWAEDLRRRNARGHDTQNGGMSRGYPDGVRIGENVGRRMVNAGSDWATEMSCADVVRRWYVEERDVYDYDNPGHKKRGSRKDDMIGHFTQVIWKDTTEVGMALVSRHFPHKSVMWYWVARYKPGGNIQNLWRRDGQDYRENVLKPNGEPWRLSLTQLRKKIAIMTGTESPFGDCANLISDAKCEDREAYHPRYCQNSPNRITEPCPSTCNRCEKGKSKKNPTHHKQEKTAKTNHIAKEKENPAASQECRDLKKYSCHLVNQGRLNCNYKIGRMREYDGHRWIVTEIYIRDRCKKSCNNCPGKVIKKKEETHQRKACRDNEEDMCRILVPQMGCTNLDIRHVCARSCNLCRHGLSMNDPTASSIENTGAPPTGRGYTMNDATAPSMENLFFPTGRPATGQKGYTMKDETAPSMEDVFFPTGAPVTTGCKDAETNMCHQIISVTPSKCDLPFMHRVCTRSCNLCRHGLSMNDPTASLIEEMFSATEAPPTGRKGYTMKDETAPSMEDEFFPTGAPVTGPEPAPTIDSGAADCKDREPEKCYKVIPANPSYCSKRLVRLNCRRSCNLCRHGLSMNDPTASSIEDTETPHIVTTESIEEELPASTFEPEPASTFDPEADANARKAEEAKKAAEKIAVEEAAKAAYEAKKVKEAKIMAEKKAEEEAAYKAKKGKEAKIMAEEKAEEEAAYEAKKVQEAKIMAEETKIAEKAREVAEDAANAAKEAAEKAEKAAKVLEEAKRVGEAEKVAQAEKEAGAAAWIAEKAAKTAEKAAEEAEKAAKVAEEAKKVGEAEKVAQAEKEAEAAAWKAEEAAKAAEKAAKEAEKAKKAAEEAEKKEPEPVRDCKDVNTRTCQRILNKCDSPIMYHVCARSCNLCRHGFSMNDPTASSIEDTVAPTTEAIEEEFQTPAQTFAPEPDATFEPEPAPTFEPEPETATTKKPKGDCRDLEAALCQQIVTNNPAGCAHQYVRRKCRRSCNLCRHGLSMNDPTASSIEYTGAPPTGQRGYTMNDATAPSIENLFFPTGAPPTGQRGNTMKDATAPSMENIFFPKGAPPTRPEPVAGCEDTEAGMCQQLVSMNPASCTHQNIRRDCRRSCNLCTHLYSMKDMEALLLLAAEEPSLGKSGEPLHVIGTGQPADTTAHALSNTSLIVILCACVLISIGSAVVAVRAVRKRYFPQQPISSYREFGEEKHALLQDGAVSINYMK